MAGEPSRREWLLRSEAGDHNPVVTFSSSEGYFDLQLRFAHRFSALTGVPIAEAINTCTNLRRRFGLFGPAGGRAWAAFLDEVRACENSRDVLRLALAALAAAPKLKPSPFGCFSYDARAADGILRLHFMPEPRHRDSSPLADNRMHELDYGREVGHRHTLLVRAKPWGAGRSQSSRRRRHTGHLAAARCDDSHPTDNGEPR